MAPSRRKLLAIEQETLTPPDHLAHGHRIARVLRPTGNNVYSVELNNNATVLVELPPRFRSTFWIKRGSYVVIDTTALQNRENKLAGEIVNVIRDEKAWLKAEYW